MSKPLQDLTGRKFGKLSVIARSANDHRGKAKWLCACECGKAHIVYSYNLLNGHTRNCPACHLKIRADAKRTHGKSKTRPYRIYANMIDRCYRKDNKRFHCYGGRGITVCEEWRTSPEKFLEWVESSGYSPNLTLDRIDVNGNYCPENCRWATAKEQANNATYNRHISFDGLTMTLAQWANRLGIGYSTLRQRLSSYGWPLDKALTSKIYHYPEDVYGK